MRNHRPAGITMGVCALAITLCWMPTACGNTAAGASDAATQDTATDTAMPLADIPVMDTPVTDTPVTDTPVTGDGGLVRVSNAVPGCLHHTWVEPAPTDSPSAWALVRLTPPSTPFTVTRVEYSLENRTTVGGNTCDPTGAHHAMVFTSADTVPAMSPAMPVLLDVPAGTAPAAGPRVVAVDLPAPVTVPAGQYLYVAVQYNGNGTNRMCLSDCTGSGMHRNYWSNNPTAPFTWDPLEASGINDNFQVAAYGR